MNGVGTSLKVCSLNEQGHDVNGKVHLKTLLQTLLTSDVESVPFDKLFLDHAETGLHENSINIKESTGVPSSKYVKLNIGGRLYITTAATICSHDWMLSRMLQSNIPSITDSDGFVVIDRCGQHFDYFLEYLREGIVDLPDNAKILKSLITDAKFYCFDSFLRIVEEKLASISISKKTAKETDLIVVSIREQFERILANTNKPIICLSMNRQNNKFSYVEKADDHFVKHTELFLRLNSRFQGIVDFVMDLGADTCEVCTWYFYHVNGTKRTEISCASIVYFPDRKQTKVDFPEARIYEEALNTLLHHCGVAGTFETSSMTKRTTLDTGSSKIR